jgi:pyruvate/2-oxoglutarate dehydrogenase complex dihydrolipoamide dehydrogenase (E3) component
MIVIGGGPAGVTAALRARELGASVALVERGPLGGTCTNHGRLPSGSDRRVNMVTMIGIQ